jgi:hypothetical protein
MTKLSCLSCNWALMVSRNGLSEESSTALTCENSTVFLWQIRAWITTPTRKYSFLGVWNANFEDSFCDVCEGYRPRAQTRTPSPRTLQRSSSQSPATNRKRLKQCNQKGNKFLRLLLCTVIRFLWVSAKFGTCNVVSVSGTLVEAKMRIFTLESTHFIFKKCPIYTHDGASAKFCTNSHETDYSVYLQ